MSDLREGEFVRLTKTEVDLGLEGDFDFVLIAKIDEIEKINRR